MTDEQRELEATRLGSGSLVDAFYNNSGQPFDTTEIESIDREFLEDADEPNFAWLLKLKSGQYAVAIGWHDYTGWDCQSGLSATVHATREDAIRFGLDQQSRGDLGLLLPDELVSP